MTNKEIKLLARKKMKNSFVDIWFVLVIVFTLFALPLILAIGLGFYFNLAVKIFSVASLSLALYLLILFPLIFGIKTVFLKFVRSGEIKISLALAGYRPFLRIFKFLISYFIRAIIIIVGLALFIVPGIIFAIMFSMTSYIMIDSPKIGIFKAMKMSAELVKGKKFELFKLGFSVIGWYLFSIITLGIGFVFVGFYVPTTYAIYYDMLISKDNKSSVASNVKVEQNNYQNNSYNQEQLQSIRLTKTQLENIYKSPYYKNYENAQKKADEPTSIYTNKKL